MRSIKSQKALVLHYNIDIFFYKKDFHFNSSPSTKDNSLALTSKHEKGISTITQLLDCARISFIYLFFKAGV